MNHTDTRAPESWQPQLAAELREADDDRDDTPDPREAACWEGLRRDEERRYFALDIPPHWTDPWQQNGATP